MKKLIALLLIFGIVGCDNQEKIKQEVDSFYKSVKEVPPSNPCEAEDAYTNLQIIETQRGTSYYSDITNKKIIENRILCKNKRAETERLQREKELKNRLKQLKNNMHVLGYVTGLKQQNYDCSNFDENEDFGYVCILNRSISDKVLFYSDPYTKLVGKIFRFVLIDKEQVPVFRTKMIERYGEPDAMAMGSILRDLNKPVDEILLKDDWGWGDVKTEYVSGFGNSLTSSKKNGISVRLHFSECDNTWFSELDCPGLFDIEENPNKVIAKIYMFGAEDDLNSSANSLRRDPREPEIFETIETDNASDIEI